MAGLDIKVDMTEFHKTFREYMKHTSRSMEEAVNQHAYYISRNAVIDTKAVPKELIEKELKGNSKDYPDVPLAAILINKERGANNKKGLTGERMAKEVDRYIKKRQKSRNFLRVGWLPAVKLLEKVVPKKRGKKLPEGVKQKGSPKGGAKPARSHYGFKPMATLWNSVFGGKKRSDRVKKIIQQGAQQAVAEEVQSMKDYIEDKLQKAAQKVGWQKT